MKIQIGTRVLEVKQHFDDAACMMDLLSLLIFVLYNY
jgi:hypothetical protein